MEEINILVVDDDPANIVAITDLLDGQEIAGCKMAVEGEEDFSEGLKRLRQKEYDILILDVFKGDPTDGQAQGQELLDEIKKAVPIAVIFYTALPARVENLKSDIVRIVHKGDGNITEEVESLISGGIPLIKKKLFRHIQEELTKYYWDFIDAHPELVSTAHEDHLFEHIIVRRLAQTLNRDGTNKIFGGDIGDDKVHPLSMYIFPPIEDRHEMGDILWEEETNLYWVILTPSCDFAQGKADNILLAPALPLTEHEYYTKYKATKNDSNTAKLKNLIKSTLPARYYFLPRINVINMPDLVIDLQKIISHPISEVENHKNIAKLDDPYAQDLLALFTRSHNRPGSPDIDDKYVELYLSDDLGNQNED
jgi:CheY-like chemotaxis protein